MNHSRTDTPWRGEMHGQTGSLSHRGTVLPHKCALARADRASFLLTHINSSCAAPIRAPLERHPDDQQMPSPLSVFSMAIITSTSRVSPPVTSAPPSPPKLPPQHSLTSPSTRRQGSGSLAYVTPTLLLLPPFTPRPSTAPHTPPSLSPNCPRLSRGWS